MDHGRRRPVARARARGDRVRAEAAPSKTPGRRLCSVTGLLGKYRDPSSGLAYATHAAAEQLKDTPPPWLQLSGNAPYYEAVRIIKKEAT